jgi:hypothetical protein
MTENKTDRKFVRLVYDLEVEVTDPMAAAAYTLDWTRDEDGGIAMVPYEELERQIAAAVSQTIGAALGEARKASDVHGFRPLGFSELIRPTDERGNYTEMTLPPMPGRRPDGGLNDSSGQST